MFVCGTQAYFTSKHRKRVINSVVFTIDVNTLFGYNCYADKNTLSEWRLNMVKVVKFGGSSLASAEQFKKVADIIKADEARRYVVPSAPGKRFSDDTKVTDMLYSCYDRAAKGKNFDAEFDAIKQRYYEIIEGLGLTISLEDEFATIRACFIGKAGRDYAASRGEYLNGIVLANYLGYDFIDSADVIFFDDSGKFSSKKTY